MKKIIVFSSAILLVAVLSFSIMSFRDNDPKKQKTECAAASKCEKNKDSADCPKNEQGSCCEKKCSKGSEECSKTTEADTDKK
jgi:hypothetical protein